MMRNGLVLCACLGACDRQAIREGLRPEAGVPPESVALVPALASAPTRAMPLATSVTFSGQWIKATLRIRNGEGSCFATYTDPVGRHHCKRTHTLRCEVRDDSTLRIDEDSCIATCPGRDEKNGKDVSGPCYVPAFGVHGRLQQSNVYPHEHEFRLDEQTAMLNRKQNPNALDVIRITLDADDWTR
jgi:hypothetical protein